MLKLLRPLLFTFCCFSMLLGLSIPVAAVSNQAVVQSYATNQTLQTGLIVGLIKGNSSEVQALTINDITTMQGVVVAPNNAAISLDNSSGSNQVYVATSGNYNVLVSTENGAINIGDYISV